MPEPLDAEEIFKALDRHRVRYVLIGGLAAVVHGSTLVTADAAITPDPATENLTRLAEALEDLDAKLRVPDLEYSVDFPLDAEAFKRFTTAAFRTRAGDVDVVLRPDGPGGRSFTYAELNERAHVKEAFGITIHVAVLDDIIASKAASGRDRDLAALPLLEELRRRLAQGKS